MGDVKHRPGPAPAGAGCGMGDTRDAGSCPGWWYPPGTILLLGDIGMGGLSPAATSCQPQPLGESETLSRTPQTGFTGANRTCSWRRVNRGARPKKDSGHPKNSLVTPKTQRSRQKVGGCPPKKFSDLIQGRACPMDGGGTEGKGAQPAPPATQPHPLLGRTY